MASTCHAPISSLEILYILHKLYKAKELMYILVDINERVINTGDG